MPRKRSISLPLCFLVSLTLGFFSIEIATALETQGDIGYTKQAQRPEQFGNITIDNYSSLVGLKPVVFPHWVHSMNYTCKVCHTDLGFQMKAGADDIKMQEIYQGKWCGKCHNGRIAFASSPKGNNCHRCHSLGLEVKENKSSNPEKYFSKLSPDPYGNNVNWVRSIIDGKICPKASLDGKQKMFVLDMDIEYEVASELGFPSVIFPHKNHTMWLHCSNCHPRVFAMKKGANPAISMEQIFQGKYCGVCHERVAFPFEDCFRCHSKGFRDGIKPEGTPKVCESYGG